MGKQPNSQKESEHILRRYISIILLLLSGSAGCLGFLYYSAESMNKPVQKEINVKYSNVENLSESAVREVDYEPAQDEPVVEIMQAVEPDAEDMSEGGIHRYEFYRDDCNWTEAFQKAQNAGGYLARINSRSEFDYIVARLSDSALDGMIIFQIGGRRDPESDEYYWVNEHNEPYGECINSADYWAVGYGWMANEPSYTDSYDNKVTQEDKLVLYNLNGNWALNDSTEGIVSWYPDHSGKVGYIVEYED